MGLVQRTGGADRIDLGADPVAAWERDGFLVLPGAINAEACAALRRRAEEVVAEAAHDPSRSSPPQEQQRTSDEWFLSSGGAIRCFFEEDAFSPDGELTVPHQQAINKIGHAQHDLDDVYDGVARSPVMAEVATALGVADPLLLQSMHIFKQPRIGGEVHATRMRPSSPPTRSRSSGCGSPWRTPPSTTGACGPSPAATSAPCGRASCVRCH